MNHRNEVNYNYNDEVNYNYNDLNFPQDNGTETGSNYNSTLNALSDPEVQILEKLMQWNKVTTFITTHKYETRLRILGWT